MSSIRYVVGDATRPIGQGPKVIAHVCNDVGRWGAGFVLALSKRWPEPELEYRRNFHNSRTRLGELGNCQIVLVAETIWVANLIAQHGIGPQDGVPPIRYYALGDALMRLADFVVAHGASVHMPRIGCGLAGGKWTEVEPYIQLRLVRRGIDVTVYDLPGAKP